MLLQQSKLQKVHRNFPISQWTLRGMQTSRLRLPYCSWDLLEMDSFVAEISLSAEMCWPQFCLSLHMIDILCHFTHFFWWLQIYVIVLHERTSFGTNRWNILFLWIWFDEHSIWLVQIFTKKLFRSSNRLTSCNIIWSVLSHHLYFPLSHIQYLRPVLEMWAVIKGLLYWRLLSLLSPVADIMPLSRFIEQRSIHQDLGLMLLSYASCHVEHITSRWCLRLNEQYERSFLLSSW